MRTMVVAFLLLVSFVGLAGCDSLLAPAENAPAADPVDPASEAPADA